MNNSIDDWLSSLGADFSPISNNTPAQSSEPAPQEETVSLTESEFDAILQENGFEGFSEAEEIVEHNNTQTETPAIDNNDGSLRIELPESEAIEAITSVNEENYPIENPDVIAENSEEQAVAPSESLEGQEPLLPPNSPTLLLDDSTSRFSGAEWYNEIQSKSVIIAGCGGIGSNCAFQMARMHLTGIHLFDDDVVERANMSGQLFGYGDIGRMKVDAVAGMLLNYTPTTSVYAHSSRFDISSDSSDIMICGFDNMEARKTFFDAWHHHILQYTTSEERSKCLYLDGRLSIDTLQVFCITGDNDYACDEYYSHHLFSDAEADETICSMKQTTYLACMIGSIMTNLFTNFVANTLSPVIPYNLPFFIEYDAQNMIFKTRH